MTLWKNITKPHYSIENYKNTYDENYYLIARRILFWSNYLHIDLRNNGYMWSGGPWDVQVKTKTLFHAKKALQKSIWQRAFRIKSKRRDGFKHKRTLRIPPWEST